MAEDDEIPWYRSLLVGVGALVGVAVLVGGLIGLVALGAVSMTGLGEPSATVVEEPSLHIPERTSDAADDTDDPGLTLEDLDGTTPTEDADPGSETSPKKEKERRKPRSVISLSVSPLEVAAMERIDLTGTYPGGEGATLQVQRFEGGWSDFAGVSATVRGGTFSTFVMTGRSGENRFRVVDRAGGKTSNVVRVRVG